MIEGEQRPRVGPGSRILRASVALGAGVGLAALVVWGFVAGRGEAAREAIREQPVKAPLRVSLDGQGRPVVTLGAEARRQSGIETGAPPPTRHQELVRAYGTVLDLDKLVTLDNSYVTAIAQLETARARLVASKAAFERAGALYKDRTTPLAQLQTAEAIFRADEAGVRTAEAQVNTLRTTAFQEWGPVIGKALVEGGPLIKRLIERQDVLLQITLPPDTSIAPPPGATVQIGAGTTQSEIRFVSLATQADPKIQSLSFYYTASADNDLLPGMSVLAFLPSGAPLQAIEVPASAVVWWNGRAWVYVATGPDTFSRHRIPTASPTTHGGFIVPAASFPQPRPDLVIKGAQVLLSEEFRAQIQVGEDKK